MDLPCHRTPAPAIHGGAIRDVFAGLWDLEPFREFLPASCGGRDGSAADVLAVLDTVAYEHVPLSLAVGITGALFVLPVAGHAEGSLARETLGRIADDEVWLGGMMMTEPGCGTDLLNASSSAEAGAGSTRLRGVKHWSGLTGHADAWLVFARDEAARRSRRMGFYLAGGRAIADGFRVEAYYDAFGMAPIPYGRTAFDARIPSGNRLGERTPYTSVLAGILTGSRNAFAGMTHGFIRRALDDACDHTENRPAFGGALVDLDQVQARLDDIRFAECVTRAMCLHVVASTQRISSNDTKGSAEAGLIKALGTDLMAEAAEHLMILRGGEGYRRGGLGLCRFIDAHPFRVFEGPNDVLYDQLARRRMKDAGTDRVAELLSIAGFTPRSRAVAYLASADRTVQAQRDTVALGRILALTTCLRWAREAGGGFSRQERDLMARVGEARVGATLAGILTRPG
jgi:alkylation response protein AidB-like acyl-CoA dehydrogenase